MKILVISMAGIGDTILATPLIHELRANFPEAQIDCAVMWSGSKDILQGNPHLNNIYQCNLLKVSKAEAFQFLKPLRKTRYHLSINTHPQSRRHYRITARFIAAQVRISHTYESWGVLDGLLINRVLPQDYEKHTVENNLAILPLLGKKRILPKHELEMFIAPSEHEWAASFIKAQNLSGGRFVGIHVGSGGTKNLTLKRWPLARFIKLVGRIRLNWPELGILLFGGPEEEGDLRQILKANDSPLVVRVGGNTLRQAAALMQRCATFLSVDTALMHIAAAVKAPNQIVIEAPTFNKTNEPYGNPFILIRNPVIAGRNLDYYRYDGQGIKGTKEELMRCMESVTVEAVETALRNVLDSGTSSKR